MFSLPNDDNNVEQNRGKYNNNMLFGIINVNLLWNQTKELYTKLQYRMVIFAVEVKQGQGPKGRPQICVAAVSKKLLPYNVVAF